MMPPTSPGQASATASAATTVCPFCGMGCHTLIQNAAAYPLQHHPVTLGALCLRGWCSAEVLDSPLRVTRATLRERGGAAQDVSVDHALAFATSALLRMRTQHGPGSVAVLGSARLSVEECTALRQLAAELETPHLDSLHRMGYVHFPPLELSEIEGSRNITILGADLALRHVQAGRRVLKAIESGARVRYVHGRRVQFAALATEHVRCLPGHELDAVDGAADDELFLLSSEPGLSGQGGRAARVLAGRRVLFLTDYVNQRGMVEAGLTPGPGGLSAFEALRAAADGRIKALLVFGDDPFEFFPALAESAFARAEFTMVVDAVKTPATERANVALPGALPGEKDGTTVNCEGRRTHLRRIAAPPAGWTEGALAARLIDLACGTPRELPPPAPPTPCSDAGSLEADAPGPEFPFLVALDTGAFWSNHALVRASVSAWREARAVHADFPDGFVSLNPDDAHPLGIRMFSPVTLESRDGRVTLPARLNPRVTPGCAWVPIHLWEAAGSPLGALAFDPALRAPVFRPRAVRLSGPERT
jgi:predicted molibdopterin-dependent oxidoreductase YjgC